MSTKYSMVHGACRVGVGLRNAREMVQNDVEVAGRTPGWSILISRTTIGLYWNRTSTLPPAPVSASVRVVAQDLAASVAALGTGNLQPVMSVISSESDSWATFHCFSWGLKPQFGHSIGQQAPISMG